MMSKSKEIASSKEKASVVNSTGSAEYSKQPGPVAKNERKCQDVFFFVLFILFWCGMIAVYVRINLQLSTVQIRKLN
jgi:hypothetical protein